MMDRLTGKRTVLLVLLLSASVVLVSGSREWVSGSVDDVALGPGVLQGRGSDIAAGALAAALVGLASGVVAATSGPVVRLIAAVSALVAAVLGCLVVVSVLVDPGGALGEVAAAGTGRSGTFSAAGRAGPWAWVALAAMTVMGVAALGALVGRRRWSGLSSRYDAGEPAEAQSSVWEQLSRGEDPTTLR